MICFARVRARARILRGRAKYFLRARICAQSPLCLKDAFDSGLCNRKKIRNVRHTNPILSTEMSDSCVFSTSKIWHPNQTRKFYENLHFLLENFFSNVSKKFFMSPTRMFKVSRRCVLPSSLRRKKNESHPTHRSKYFWEKITPPQTGFEGKGWQSQWIFNLIWRDVYFTLVVPFCHLYMTQILSKTLTTVVSAFSIFYICHTHFALLYRLKHNRNVYDSRTVSVFSRYFTFAVHFWHCGSLCRVTAIFFYHTVSSKRNMFIRLMKKKKRFKSKISLEVGWKFCFTTVYCRLYLEYDS